MIILIRGIPGSGKSTLAKKMVSDGKADAHIEADMWFEDKEFDPRNLSKAHNWCIDTARKLHEAGFTVVVSNTFVRLWEMEAYFKIDPLLTVIEANGAYQNIHGVPEKTIERMKLNWECFKNDSYRF